MTERRPRPDLRPIEERREARQEQILEKRHQTAMAAFQIEKFILENLREPHARSDDHTSLAKTVERRMEVEFSHLPETLQRSYRKFATTYFDAVAKATQQEQDLQRITGLDQVTEKRSKALFGRELFQVRTGREPRGEVMAERQEGFLLIACELQRDYAAMEETTGGVASREEKSRGAYYHGMSFGDYNAESVLLIHGLPEGTQEPRFSSIVRHERQHFLNHNIFDTIEPPTATGKGLPERRLWDIKDELLACLRDGKNADRIQLSLSGETHNYLFEAIPEEQRKPIYRLIEKITRAIGEVETLFDTNDKRAILVNHLLDIPLTRFPEWLQALKTFYSKRGQVFGS